MKNAILCIFAILCCASNIVFAAQTWQSLDANQRQALAPLAQQWATFSEKQQLALLRVAKRYPTLTLLEKQRLQKKLIAWSKLTPEQRKAAREKYQALNKNPAAKHAQATRLGKPKQPKENGSQPVVISSVSPIPASAIATPIKN